MQNKLQIFSINPGHLFICAFFCSIAFLDLFFFDQQILGGHFVLLDAHHPLFWNLRTWAGDFDLKTWAGDF